MSLVQSDSFARHASARPRDTTPRDTASRDTTHNAFAVEVDETTVGIVIRDGGNDYTFIAAAAEFYPLDQRRFASPAAAQRAALALASNRRGTLRSFAAR
ncbi:hypothetical protein [Rhodoplanes elegans]|uniref:hypothetical protein n=1 Tax=Rhodoplanes elegans TaxID=29408 RepID=UPI001A91BCF0|nr:hypothetical protein [Rhodoplanes elegans]